MTFVDFSLVREKDFFVYFEKLWNEIATYFDSKNTAVTELKEFVELRDRVLYPSERNELKFQGNSFG